MKTVITRVYCQIRAWKRDVRVWAAFLLGFGICIRDCGVYLSYANDADKVTQILEPFIVLGSRLPFMMALMLGGMLLLSDAPFVRPITEYEILREGYRSWFIGSVAYIIFSCVIYFAAMLAFSCVMALLYSGVVFDNSWSEALETLALQQPDYVVRKYAFAFPFPEMVEAALPLRVMLETFVFETLYTAFIGICMLVVNLLTKQNIGWIVAAVIHIWGYIAYANGGSVIPLKYSPLCCALTAYHYIAELGMSALYSFLVLLILSGALAVIGYKRIPKSGLV